MGPARCVPTALRRAFCSGLHRPSAHCTLLIRHRGKPGFAQPYFLSGLAEGGFLGALFTAASLLTRDFSMKLNTPVPFNCHATSHTQVSGRPPHPPGSRRFVYGFVIKLRHPAKAQERRQQQPTASPQNRPPPSSNTYRVRLPEGITGAVEGAVAHTYPTNSERGDAAHTAWGLRGNG